MTIGAGWKNLEKIEKKKNTHRSQIAQNMRNSHRSRMELCPPPGAKYPKIWGIAIGAGWSCPPPPGARYPKIWGIAIGAGWSMGRSSQKVMECCIFSTLKARKWWRVASFQHWGPESGGVLHVFNNDGPKVLECWIFPAMSARKCWSVALFQ